MICPRCRTSGAELVAKSPVADAWEMYLCPACKFSWRTSEPPAVTDPEQYDQRFRLTAEQLARFAEVPPVPAGARKGPSRH